MLIIALFLFCGGHKSQSEGASLIKNSQQTIGQVTYKHDSYSRGGTIYHLKYTLQRKRRFICTASGKETVKEEFYQSVNPGDKINLVYD